MGFENCKKKALNELERLYGNKGFITVDEVINVTETFELPLDEVERLSGLLTDKGVIIRDDSSENDINSHEEDIIDWSRVDYEQLYNRAIKIDLSLKPYIDEVRNILPPQYGEETTLIYQAKEGNVYASERLIKMNLRIVIKMALTFYKNYEFPLVDSIQYGNVGLIKALNKMTLTPGARFSTYAPWWIRQSIFRNINIGDNFQYIPVHLQEKLFYVYKEKGKHFCEKCCDTFCYQLIDEISKKLKISSKKALKYLNLIERPYSIEELATHKPSLFSDDGNCESMVIQGIEEKSLRITIMKLLDQLKERERKVLILRFGLSGEDPMTLEQIGSILELTRERIRQIEKKALRRLKHPSRLSYLKDY